MAESPVSSRSSFETLPQELADHILRHLESSCKPHEYAWTLASLRRVSRATRDMRFGKTAKVELETRRVITSKNCELLLTGHRGDIHETEDAKKARRARVQDTLTKVTCLTICSWPEDIDSRDEGMCFPNGEPLPCFPSLQKLCVYSEALTEAEVSWWPVGSFSQSIRRLLSGVDKIEVCVTPSSRPSWGSALQGYELSAFIFALPSNKRVTFHLSYDAAGNAFRSMGRRVLKGELTGLHGARVICHTDDFLASAERYRGQTDVMWAGRVIGSDLNDSQSDPEAIWEIVNPQYLLARRFHRRCPPAAKLISAVFDVPVVCEGGSVIHILADIDIDGDPAHSNTAPATLKHKLKFTYTDGDNTTGEDQAEPCSMCHSYDGC